MSPTLPTLCCAALAALAATGDEGSPALPAPQGNQFRILPVGGLTAPFVQDPLPPLGLALGRLDAREDLGAGWDRAYPEAASLLPLPSQRPIDADRLVGEAVAEGRAAWEAEGASIQPVGDRVFATNKAEVLDGVRAHWDRLRATIAPRLRLRYVLFDDQKRATPSYQVLDREAALRLLDRAATGQLGAVRNAGAAECRAGDRVYMGDHGRTWLQADLDVEVASDSKIGDPVIQAIPTGRGLACLPVVRPDGRSLALFCFFSSREVGPGGIHDQDVVAPGLTKLELADVVQVQSAFSAAIGPGGGVVVAPGGALDPSMRVLVVADRLDPAPAADGAAGIVPTGLVATEALTRFFFRQSAGRRGIELEDRLDVDGLIELCRTLSGAADREGFDISAGPIHLTIRGEPAEVRKARQAAGFATRSLDRSFLVEVVQEGQPAGEPGAPWSPLGAPLVVPCLGDRVGFALHGVQRGYLADFNVEISEKSSIADPVVASVFDGTQVLASVEPLDAACRVELMLLSRSILAMRRVAAGAEAVGAVTCPEEAEVTFDRAVTLRPGATSPLGDGPVRRVDGVEQRTRFTLKLTEL